MKPISKKEQKARTYEANVKRNKKRDFRKFANQMFKDPTHHLPMQGPGMGPGRTAYCYNCGMTAPKTKSVYNKGLKIYRYSRADAYINDIKEKVHPTQKPVKLFTWIIENYTQPSDTIFDPFMGSKMVSDG